MLGRKTYTAEELDNARKAINAQMAAYKKLVKSVDASDPRVAAALEDFDARFATTMVMALDRFFVHRLRQSTGKDANALNEVEMMVESLLNHGGVFTGNNVIKWIPADTVLELEPGDRIAPTSADFERLAKAFLAAIDERFVTA